MQDPNDLYNIEKTTTEKCRILAGDVAAEITRIKVCQDAINQYCEDNGIEPPVESKMYGGDEFLLDFLQKLGKRAEVALEKAEKETLKTIKDKKARDEYLRKASYKNRLGYTYKI